MEKSCDGIATQQEVCVLRSCASYYFLAIDGPADRAGLLVGDMIVAVADIDVRKSTQIHVNRMIMHG